MVRRPEAQKAENVACKSSALVKMIPNNPEEDRTDDAHQWREASASPCNTDHDRLDDEDIVTNQPFLPVRALRASFGTEWRACWR
jgi:hypothetical protein